MVMRKTEANTVDELSVLRDMYDRSVLRATLAENRTKAIEYKLHEMTEKRDAAREALVELRDEIVRLRRELAVAQSERTNVTCPHDNVSLPTTSDPQTVCADCGAVIE